MIQIPIPSTCNPHGWARSHVPCSESHASPPPTPGTRYQGNRQSGDTGTIPMTRNDLGPTPPRDSSTPVKSDGGYGYGYGWSGMWRADGVVARHPGCGGRHSPRRVDHFFCQAGVRRLGSALTTRMRVSARPQQTCHAGGGLEGEDEKNVRSFRKRDLRLFLREPPKIVFLCRSLTTSGASEAVLLTPRRLTPVALSTGRAKEPQAKSGSQWPRTLR